MNKQLKDYLDKQEDALFKARIHGAAVLIAFIAFIAGAYFLINYVGF